MEINHAALAATAVRPDQFPAIERPEVAFAGKSNVGKSSLINAMVNRKGLARSSQNPGKTRTINFYDVEHIYYFVDLPGYGYAKVTKSESAKWGRMVEGYLKNRPSLLAVILLLDIRHEPNKNDLLLYDWCRYYHLPVILVATKSDKIKRSQLQKQLAVIRRTLQSGDRPGTETGFPPLLPFSSETRDGRDDLWTLLIDLNMKFVL